GSRRSVSNRDYTVSDPAPAATLAADTKIFQGYYPGFPGKYDYLVPVINHPEMYNRFRAQTNTQALLDYAGDVCTGVDKSSPLSTQQMQITTNYNCNSLKGTED